MGDGAGCGAATRIHPVTVTAMAKVAGALSTATLCSRLGKLS